MVLVACLAASGCGAGAGGAPPASALTARIDHLESENADLSDQLEEMSRRITELENLVLKQMNELKKLGAAQAKKPKTLEALPGAQEPASAWDTEPIVASAPGAMEADTATPNGDDEEEEDRPLLKLYGTPEPDPVPTTGSSDPVKVTSASLLTDTQSLGGFVPLKLPTLDEDVPTLQDALSGDPAPSGGVDPYEQAIIKYEKKEWASAILYFDLHLKHEPKGARSINALFLKAECFYQMGSYLEAIGQFELVLERYPGSSRAASALLRIGRCYEKLGDKNKAKSVYQQLILDHPDSGQAKKGAKLLEALK